MTKLYCYSKREFAGILMVKNGFLIIESKNKSFIDAVQELSEQGIPVTAVDSTVRVVFPKDPRFILFLEKFLSKCGLQVIRVDTELVSKLKQKIKLIDSSLSEKKLNEEYGDFSIFEASLLLRTLDSLAKEA